MGDYGYHAGDLGKSEFRKDFRNGRGTGHFGTGTYFVSKPDLLSGDYRKRPVQKIDFSKYKNLYKPKNDDDAWHLHDALSELNNNTKRVVHGFDAEKYYDDIEKTYQEYNPYHADTLNRLAELVGEKPFEGSQIGDNGYVHLNEEDDDRAYKMLQNLRYHGYDKYLRPMFSANRAEKYLRDTFGDEAFDKFREYYDSGKNEDDSFSTVFMKGLGYNGIDNRGIYSMDNTGYGSVIYDLDDEDSALRDKLKAEYLYGRNFK